MTISRENPHIFEVMNLVKNNVMSNINCHNIGKIVEFFPENQTCTVQLMQVKQYNDKYYNPAPILDVPLIIYGAGSGHITLPNPVGTYCLLFFMDRNIDNFLETGEQYTPETSRMHDFTDCIAITTFKTLVNPISNYDENAVSILNDIKTEEEENHSFIKVYPDEIKLNVSQTSEDVTQEAKITMDDKIHLEADQGAVINLSDKILLRNSTQNFLALMTELIDNYIYPLQPSEQQKQSLNQLKTKFAALFETVQENT